jgi:hypothetical protein
VTLIYRQPSTSVEIEYVAMVRIAMQDDRLAAHSAPRCHLLHSAIKPPSCCHQRE